MRRTLFDGEIGINVENPDNMELLAEMLEIQSDGGDSAGDFVAYTIKRFDSERRAAFHERMASRIRRSNND